MQGGEEARLIFHADCVGFYCLLRLVHGRGEMRSDSGAFVPFRLDAGRLLDPSHGLVLQPGRAYSLTFLVVSLQQLSLEFCICMSLTGRGLIREKMVAETCLAFLLLFFISLIPVGLKIAVYGRCRDRR